MKTYFNIILPANILSEEVTTAPQSERKDVHCWALLQIVTLMCVAIAVSEAGVIAGYGVAGLGHAGLGYGVAGLGHAGVAYGVAPVAAVAPVAHVAPAVAAVAAPHAAVDYHVSVAQWG